MSRLAFAAFTFLAAGCAPTNMPPERDLGSLVRLSQSEVQAFFADAIIRHGDPETGEVADPGEMMCGNGYFARLQSRVPIRGRWSAEGGEVCHRIEGLALTSGSCFAVYRGSDGRTFAMRTGESQPSTEIFRGEDMTERCEEVGP